MSGDLVLLTGSTGFLGYLILTDLLKHGYRVRAAVRSQTKAKKILAGPSVKALAPSPEQLSFVTVPDMTAQGAYDDAVQGVKYIIHAASPIPSFGEGEPPAQDQLEEALVKKALKGALGMLESAHAKAGGSVRRVVMTSSTVAVVPFEVYMGQGTEPDRVWTSEDRIPVAEGPYAFEFQAYSAGKAAVLNASEEFVRTRGTTFDLISITPSWIFGKDELVTDAASMRVGSTNSVLLGVLLGVKNDSGYGGNAVHGPDVAKAHVLSLDPRVKGNQSFVLNSMMNWEDAITIAKKYYPDAFATGKLRDDGKQPTMALKWDASKAKKQLGLELAPFDTMVKEVVGQYLELLALEEESK
ncbi:NAD(P)-binding protein [Coniochaeta sp. PMI_546]|nr:NAD(P)-binding protein [Coniochaeta sp. PMI_546]